MLYLDHINALLHQAVATCKAATQVSKPVDSLTKKEKVPPGKSVEHQWRFKKQRNHLEEKRAEMF